MRKSFLLLSILGITSNGIYAINQAEYTYYTDVQLQGTKKSVKYENDYFPVLFLAKGIKVIDPEFDSAEFNITEDNVKEIQIASHEKVPNGCVIIKGKLYHAGENPTHKTKVIIVAESIKLCK